MEMGDCELGLTLTLTLTLTPSSMISNPAVVVVVYRELIPDSLPSGGAMVVLESTQLIHQ